jgi:hydrogenase expression/formation protein HypD
VKYVDEFRDGNLVEKLAADLARSTTKPWTLMEICGGQTHTIVKEGLDELLPRGITLVHGPGCPVCVTPIEQIDRGIAICKDPRVIFCTVGDMVRVPGSRESLQSAKAKGGDVRIVYSPLESIRLARENPDREVVFFAVGFETTAPANAMAVAEAKRLGLRNYSVLVSHVRVPPAMNAILEAPGNRIEGFLAAGHVCAVMGTDEYEPLARTYKVPIVVTGFEAVDILQGVLICVRQLEEGKNEVRNQYARAVSREGNRAAQKLMRTVFRVVDRTWRGIGEIPRSGLALAEAYSEFDAETRFGAGEIRSEESKACIAGLVLQGLKKPADCPVFGDECRPERPLGAPMVSSEGACAAYFRYRGSGRRGS